MTKNKQIPCHMCLVYKSEIKQMVFVKPRIFLVPAIVPLLSISPLFSSVKEGK